MKTFLQQIEEAFEAIDKTDNIVNRIANHELEDDELEEASTSGGAGAYMTPNAFSPAPDSTVEVLGYERVRESVRTPATYRPGEHQRPESAEEEYNGKFSFSSDHLDWQHEKYEYPSVPFAKSYKKYSDRLADVEERFKVQYDWSGVKNKTDKNVYETMDSKYEQLIESYKRFATGDAKLTPEAKIKHTIKEVAKRLREVDELVTNTARLKTESGMARDGYGKSVETALNKISERLIKISERVRALGE
jgi:hypothetical protein